MDSDTNQPTDQPASPKFWEAFELLERTILIKNDGEEFEFAIPSSMHEIKIGAAMRKLRREADPAGAGPGEEYGWDDATFAHTRALAVFLVCLEKTSAKWVYSADQSGKPIIDPSKWPPETAERVLEIYLAFNQAVGRFRAARNKPK
jgi:hypothetical protein